ncbi:putative toxin-antitoxin system toxin component, PIN family [Chiayiivirga flava]|uniref:Putative PIN family toxin of toxin-antitoxin system n=1 Tax=Chiayiivirga flava TaxID=659595 RepID=A0A7W8D603_9GAMM|nr:putative toxin-antitoxin system toxin component, PIN family [Chiayiivirga flava]MBB5206883.1 putative PIN family toxin of toxin-antitoxin system [Chiayiivirga flava]
MPRAERLPDAPAARRTHRVVLDTNACLDLLVFSSQRSGALRDLLAGGQLQAVTRADCRDEWRRVLRYTTLALDAHRCTELEAAYDTLMLDVGTAPAGNVARLPRCKDPDDQKFLELARDAGASLLLTRDAELLVLARRTARAGLFRIAAPVDVMAALAELDR